MDVVENAFKARPQNNFYSIFKSITLFVSTIEKNTKLKLNMLEQKIVVKLDYFD